MQSCGLGCHFVQFVVRPQNPWAQRAISNMLGPQWTNWRLFGGFLFVASLSVIVLCCPVVDIFNVSGVVFDVSGVFFVVSVLSCFCWCFAMSWVQAQFGMAELFRTRLYWNVAYGDWLIRNNMFFIRQWVIHIVYGWTCFMFPKDFVFMVLALRTMPYIHTYIYFATTFSGYQMHMRQSLELPL